MEKFLGIVGAAVLVGVIFILATPIAVLVGAFAGWTVQFFMPVTTAELLAAAGITLPLWKVGAGLAFVGAFFKTTVSKKE